MYAFVQIVNRETGEVVKEHEFRTEREWKAFNFYWVSQCDWKNWERREAFDE